QQYQRSQQFMAYFMQRPNRGRAQSGSNSPRPFNRHNQSNRTNGRSNKRFSGEHIDISRFINQNVVVTQEVAYQPVHSFNDFKLDDRLTRNLSARGYTHPTPIQDQSIEQVMNGQDVIGLANTGTGKTAAFLLPILSAKLNHQP